MLGAGKEAWLNYWNQVSNVFRELLLTELLESKTNQTLIPCFNVEKAVISSTDNILSCGKGERETGVPYPPDQARIQHI